MCVFFYVSIQELFFVGVGRVRSRVHLCLSFGFSVFFFTSHGLPLSLSVSSSSVSFFPLIVHNPGKNEAYFRLCIIFHLVLWFSDLAETLHLLSLNRCGFAVNYWQNRTTDQVSWLLESHALSTIFAASCFIFLEEISVFLALHIKSR